MWERARRLLRSRPAESAPEPPATQPTFVIGDVHGQLETFRNLLRAAGLADAGGRWKGRDARLWLVGDLVDRGPDGIGVIELVQGLQREGDVHCLLGNHELLLLLARRHPEVAPAELGASFHALWVLNGGTASDLARLTPEHVAWLQALPAIALEGETLILHADSGSYLRRGTTVVAANAAIRKVVAGEDTRALYDLLSDSTDRHAFADPAVAERMLSQFGGRRIVHGHTPISLVLDRPAVEVTEPFVYGDGRCVNVDHGLFLGGRGFVTELSQLPGPSA